jgi:hypothetical protein
VRNVNLKSAFGIIELSIILTVISIIIAVVTSTKVVERKVETVGSVIVSLDKFVDSISQFASSNKRFPCPASIEAKPSDANFGKEQFDNSNDDKTLHQCSGAGIFFGEGSSEAQNLVYGMLPINDLGLSISAASDSFGAKLVYIVDKRLARNNGIANNYDSDPIINLENKVTNTSQMLDFIVISYGSNKNNAYNLNSISKNNASIIEDEISNQLISASGANFDNNFVKSSNDKKFDDIIVGGKKYEIIKEFSVEDVIRCEQHSDFLYGINMVWNSDGSARSGEIIASDTPCPSDFSYGPTNAYKRCVNGIWGNVEVGCKSAPSCYVNIEGVETQIVDIGSGILPCSLRGYSGSINYNCNELVEGVSASGQVTEGYDGDLVINGSCNNIGDGCYIEDFLGIDNHTVIYGVNKAGSSGTIQCREGFTGSLTYDCQCTLGGSFTEHCPINCPCTGKYQIGEYPSVHSNGISGMVLDSGVKITVYSGGSFTGSTAVFTSTQDNCSNGWNDLVRSYKFEMINGICPEANINLSVTDSCAIATLPDFSSVIDAAIGDQSELDNIEPNIKLWLDSSNIDGNNNRYVKNGQKINKWYDLSGNNYNLTQTTISRQPIYNETGLNNRPVIDFDGDKFLLSGNFNSTSDITVLAVFQIKNSWGAWGYVFGHGSRDSNWSFERMNATSSLNFQTANDNDNLLIPANFDEPYLMVGKIANGNIRSFYLYSNSDKEEKIVEYAGGAKINENSLFRIGYSQNGSEYSDAKISEIIYFDKSLADNEIWKIKYYLSKKWGLEDFVDSDGDGVVDSLDDTPYGESRVIFSEAITQEIGDLAGNLSHLNSNLKLWLDAQNTNANNNGGLIDGSAISQWNDLSGNNYHLTQSLSGYRPVISSETNKNYVDFVSNDFLTTNLSQGFSDLNGEDRTIIVLFKQEEVADNPYGGSGIISTRPFGSQSLGFTFSVKNNQTAFAYSREQSSSEVISSDIMALNQFHILSFRTTKNDQQILKEGKIIAQELLDVWDIQNSGNLVLGKERHAELQYGYKFHGKIAEVIIFDKKISDEDLYKINHYLAKKWGHESSLDSDGDGVVDSLDENPTSHLILHFTFDNTNISEIGDYKIISYDEQNPDILTYDLSNSRDLTPVLFKHNQYYTTAGSPTNPSDFFKLNRDLDLRNYPKFSISFWAMANSDIDGQALTGGSATYSRLFNMRKQSHGYIGYQNTNIGIVYDYWQNGTPYNQAWVQKAYYIGDGSWSYLKSNNFAMDYRNWVHYAFTFDMDNDYIAFYKNGQLNGYHNTSINYSDLYPYFHLGSHGSSPGDGQRSYFDDFRIYSVALTASEVEAIYNETDKITLQDKMLYYGNGIDGDVTINSGNINTTSYIIGRTAPDGEAFSVEAINVDKITVKGVGTGGTSSSNVANSFKVGDILLLINMRGDANNFDNVGNYEFVKVQGVEQNNITINGQIKKIYGLSDNSDLTGQSVMIQRVPQYDNLYLNGNITVQDWDGQVGGIFAVKVKNILVNNTSIDVSKKGYRGGARVDGGSAPYGLQGESISGQTNIMINSNNQGGGGGGISCGHAAGGAGGGYGANGANGSNGSHCSPGGTAGLAYGENSFPSKIFLGSGGGSGGEDNRDPQSWAGPGHKGGDGGGIIMIYANNMTINSGANFIANGENGESRGSTYGQDGGGGGGGSGGSINIVTNNYNGSLNYQINGGSGGSVDTNGDGGAGGAGRFKLSSQIAELDIADSNLAYSFDILSLGSKISLWLDATNIDGYDNSTLSDGNKISSWKNLAKSNALTQTNISNQPTLVKGYINQKPAVKFDRSSKHFLQDLSFSENLNTIFFVYKPNNDINKSTSSCGGINFNQNSNIALFFGSITGELNDEILSFNSGNPLEAWVAPNEEAISSQNANIFAVRYSGSNMNLYYNGIIKNNAVRQENVHEYTTNGIKLSQSTALNNDLCYLDGYIAELIIVNQALTNDEFNRINYYLSYKWGLMDVVDSDADSLIDSADSFPLKSEGEVLVKSIPPKLWLDSKNIDGQNNLTISGAISSWYDLSGNSYNVTQSSTSNQPSYDGAGVYFDGSNDYMWTESLESLNEATIFAVLDLGNIDFSGNNAGGGAVTIQQQGVDNFDSIVYHESSDADRKFMHGSSSFQRIYVSSVAEVDTGPFIYQYQIKSGEFAIYRNGVLVGQSTYNSTNKPNTRFILGNRHFVSSGTSPVSDGYWFGRIYETIILNRKVTDEERSKITHYLASKWNLSGEVDSDSDGVVDNIDTNPLVALDEVISPYAIFDGVDDRYQTSVDSFRGIDAFTIVFLAKPTYTGNSMQLAAKPHGGRCTTAISLAVNNTGTASMSLDNFSGKPYCIPYRGLGGWTGKTSTNLINWDEVNLIAFKGYYHQFTIYINGLEETSNERDNGHPNAANTVWNIGSSWSISSLFQGEIYKFAIFNQRISKEQLDNMRDLENWEGQNNLIHYIDFKKYFPPDSVQDTGGLTVTSYGRD